MGEEVLLMIAEKALSEVGDEGLQWNRDSGRPCGKTLGNKSTATGTEAIKLQKLKA